ncbi:MAG TPA: F0F1 ATP synthase subunit A [Candidatus Polarisedimenticolia bacterium]|nr:F0F1 ATP synthase subunit A [Candidatus Polarisedimenticolia bacterium]
MTETVGHEAVEAGQHAAAGAEHAAGGQPDIGGTIMHHITDGNTLDLGFTQIQLPSIHLFGIDFSITKHVVFMWVAAALLIIGFGLAFKGRKLIPRGFSNLLEMLVVFVRDDICIKNLGEHHGRKLAPYMLTLFFFILTCNLLGLVPLGASATGNVNVTAGLAILTFLMIQVEGIREHGFFRHWKNLVPHGLPIFVLPIMIVVEILGMFVKPFALTMRLFANMTAGHVAILAFLGMIFIFKSALASLVAVPLALGIMLLEVFVAFLQAYIFAMLTSLFIGLSLHPAH